MKFIKQFSFLCDLYYWKTVLLLVNTGQKKRYGNSFLGSLWSLLVPFTTFIIFAVIMPVIINRKTEHYALYIACTVPLWALTTSSVLSSTTALLLQAETLKRCIISKSIFPVVEVFRCVQDFLKTFFMIYAVLLLLGFPGTWYALLVPLYLIPMLVSITAMSVGIAYLTPYVRDLRDFLALAMNVIGWCSAVPYLPSLLPENARYWIEWNPFYILMRPVIMLVYEQRLPDVLVIGKLLVIMLLSILFGYILYRRCHKNFIYYL